MKLFEVTNGYIGESYVRCLVVAENEHNAIVLAQPAFLAQGNDRLSPHPPAYWESLKAECLCDDTNVPWVGKVGDG